MNESPKVKVDGKKLAELRRRKFLLNQQKKNEQQQNKEKDDEWFKRHSAFITQIDFVEAKKLKLFSKLQKLNLQGKSSRKRPRVEAEKSSSDVCEHESACTITGTADWKRDKIEDGCLVGYCTQTICLKRTPPPSNISNIQ